MADVVLTVAKSLVEGTLTKAQLAIEEEEKLRKRAQRDLVFITGEFQMMQSFLSLTTKENVKNNFVSTCVTQVRDLAYDVEDCIEFILHLDAKPDWWCRLIPSCMAPVRALDEAVDILEHLKVRVQDLSERNARYKLISDHSGPNPVMEMRQPATAGASDMKRRDMDALTKLVTKRDSKLQVITVWALKGDLGAASIIRKAYDSTKIWGNFGVRAWVKVGNTFDLHVFHGSLMDEFFGAGVWERQQAPVAEDYLIQEIREQLNNQTYLIVLEDLSTIVDWGTIRRCLPDGRNGCRIVVLTQQFQIASSCTGLPYIQRFWADESLCVFSKEGPLIGRMFEMKELPMYPSRVRANDSQVMSVWGISGAGKSALVRNLYRDMVHSNYYEKHIWLDASHPFSFEVFCQSLLFRLHLHSLETNEAIPRDETGIRNHVQECHDFLKDHRCLVVIDNLQSTEEWDIIQNALVFRPSESVVIVITNDESVALHCADRKDLVFNVKGLEVSAAIDLFKKEVSKNPDFPVDDIDTQLELRQLISKCGGLPKVIVAVADSLAQEFAWAERTSILNDQFVGKLETRSEFACLRGLFCWMHSYLGALPEHLRQHFAYLLIFPGQRRIRRRRLLMRWVAEGYSKDSDRYTANENGEKIFSKLVQLSMVHPPLKTITHMRMVSYEVSNIFHEYMVTRPPEENIATAIEVFGLRGTCSPTSRRRGRHLVIEQSWDRDRIVFKNIDFSRLRSLTVFGNWEEFFISESMKVLRVLDLEDALGVTNKDLQNILKQLPRLKFLSLRGCSKINYLPSSVGELRQLQILDVRYTNIVNIPASITKLKKLQYLRAGPTAPPEDPSAPCTVAFKLSELRRYLQLIGVEVTSGIGELTALHTLGVINVGAAGGKVILKQLRNLTQLRKLGVSGVSKKNSKEFLSAVLCHPRLESLSVWLNKNNKDCLDGMSAGTTNETLEPPKKLQSLKLYGPVEQLPMWMEQLSNLRKLNLDMDTLSDDDIRVLGGLQELCILRLRVNPVNDGMVKFCVMKDGVEDRCYKEIKVLEIASRSNLLLIIGVEAMENLELLKAGCCGTGSLPQFGVLKHLKKLKEVHVIGSHDEEQKRNLENKFAEHPSRPALTLGEVNQSAQASTGGNDERCSFPLTPTSPSGPAIQPSCP